MEIKDKVAVITGGGSGIGRAIALEFARQGMPVVCTGRRENRLKETVDEIKKAGGRAAAVPADVTDRQQVDRLVRSSLDAFGRVDVLYNNHGSFNTLGGLWEVDPDRWWDDVTINLRGSMLTSYAVLPHMMKRDSGVIINMNGGGSTYPMAGGSAYACSKAALLRLTDTLARELERAGSKVMCVAMGPGFVRTEMTQLQADAEMGRKWLPGSKTALDAGQSRPPEDCAKKSVELLRHLRPEFNGRIFGVDTDFADVNARAEEIASKDLLTLRGR